MADETAATAPGPEASAGPVVPPGPLPQSGAGDEEEDASAAKERCRAMMEVVATDGAGGKGKWKVSKLAVEHNHELRVAPGEVAATVPALGMEFDSLDDAKGFYYGYGERVGFKARMGSIRCSVEDGEKIMQRFLCCRGNCTNRRSKGKDSDEGNEAEELVKEGANVAGKRKREPYKTRSRKPVAKNTEMIEVEKGVGTIGTGNGRASRGGRNKKDLVEKEGEPVDMKVVHDGAAEDETEDEGELGDDGVDEEVQVVKEKRGRGRPKKAVTDDDALQARVLRELGLRASQYDMEERKKILRKYLSKRQSRPASGRPTKIASRQALAERRKRGDGGRFLASEGHQPLQQPSERRSKRLERQNLKKEEKAESKEDDLIEAEPDPETEVVAGPGGEPKIGMVFLDEDKAYEFYGKILRDTFQGSETFQFDFSRWLYVTGEEDFVSSWEILLEKYNLKDNEWLSKLFGDRERWALPYGRDIFCADIAEALRNDNTAEQQADYLGVQMTQRVAPLMLLWQAANSYTPAIFEMFRLEFEQILNCMVYSCGEIGSISEFENEVSNSEPRRATSKKNKNLEVRRQQQNPLDSNKKKKSRQGLPEPEEIEIPLRVDPPTVSNDIPNHLRNPTNQFLAPSHIMQAPYVTQQFGLGSLQGFPGMSPFGQIQEPTPGPLQQPHLQPPSFHSGSQMPQASPPDIQSLQFLSGNPQLGHQTTDQGQYTIPVWDFL
ncbi:hypothetical protein QOZ80_3AG0213830 [Eleusine coracana subsp. coracana]|nr:hypothetical protein QOZ80_3AG0213830 [Eleusine coracana subsp. coracana]